MSAFPPKADIGSQSLSNRDFIASHFNFVATGIPIF